MKACEDCLQLFCDVVSFGLYVVPDVSGTIVFAYRLIQNCLRSWIGSLGLLTSNMGDCASMWACPHEPFVQFAGDVILYVLKDVRRRQCSLMKNACASP
jgi:hypothetical protein